MPRFSLSRFLRFGGMALAIAFLGAVATPSAGLADGPTPQARPSGIDDAVFREGFTLIAERYIRPVQIDRLALDGLHAVDALDPSVGVTDSGGRIVVSSSRGNVRMFVAPGRDDAEGWGELVAEVVRTEQDTSSHLRALGSEKLYKAVFDGALANLDRYSRYAGRDAARENRADREGFGGIGMHLSVVDGVTRIVAVMPGTPAEQAGLEDNDIISRIEGEPVAGMALSDVVHRLRGPVGSVARFTVVRDGVPDPIHVSVRRAKIIPTSVIYRREGLVAYIRITRFNEGTADSFRDALTRARREIGPSLAGIVIDLRDNPGGLLDQAVAVSDLVLTGGRIVSTRGRHRASFQQYDAHDGDIADGLPIALLINGGSASASEIVAAALQDDGRAVVIGSNSYGKGVVQSVYRLPNDGELTLTWSRYHAPSGYNLQNLGVLPNICTSGKKNQSVAALLRGIQDDRARTTALLTDWRRDSHPKKEAREAMRKACPSTRVRDTGKDRDLAVAKAVLEDASLYRVALHEASLPELAKHE